MMYCFVCPKCGFRNEFESRKVPVCQGDASTFRHHSVQAARDYRAEAVGIGSGVRVSKA
jgi:hypothetical protein